MRRGWKEISEYLIRVHPSAIRRWVRKKGFSVILGERDGVWLMTSEMLINMWLAQQADNQIEKLKRQR